MYFMSLLVHYPYRHLFVDVITCSAIVAFLLYWLSCYNAIHRRYMISSCFRLTLMICQVIYRIYMYAWNSSDHYFQEFGACSHPYLRLPLERLCRSTNDSNRWLVSFWFSIEIDIVCDELFLKNKGIDVLAVRFLRCIWKIMRTYRKEIK